MYSGLGAPFKPLDMLHGTEYPQYKVECVCHCHSVR
jgi:hypothetical protein